MEFNRQKIISVKEIGSNKILAKGVLKDEFHHMKCILTIALPFLEIADAKVEIIKLPMEICKVPLSKVPSLKGMKIQRGFRRNIKKAIGGNLGCIHLLDLIFEIAQGVIQLLGKDKRTRSNSLALEKDLFEVMVGKCIGLEAKDGKC